jgi:alkanesulfonate monooxygenase SsuD/methylene tetrahydromethanopterin reductase-like flavin-dependent oxidoreductase (luciferase family)
MPYDIEINSAAHYPAAAVPELVHMAEDAGFGAFWKGESNSTDPMVLLSAAASRTTHIKLGTAIYHIYGRSPVALGIQAASLQDLSAGRLLLGLGVANKSIAGWHDGVFDRPLRRIREYVDIVKRVTAGQRVEYTGEIYRTGERFQLAWKPQYPHVPVYLAALGPQMSKLTGRIADGVCINMAPPEKIRDIVKRVHSGAREAGRDPDRLAIVAKCRVSLHPDRAQARSRLRQVLTFYNLADHYSHMLKDLGFEAEVNQVQEAFARDGFKAAMGAITDAYMDRLPVIPATSIQEIKAKLLPFVEAGATRLVVPFVPSTDAPVEDLKGFLQAWGAHA